MIGILILIAIVYIVLSYLFNDTPMHQWIYRNPYDRACRICGRHEVDHCEPGAWNRSWWEVFSEGDASKHNLPPL